MRYLVGLGCLLLSVQVAAAPIESMARLLEPYPTFSADFKQSTLDPEGSPINQMNGELAIASQSNFYWKINPPFSQVIVADGEVLFHVRARADAGEVECALDDPVGVLCAHLLQRQQRGSRAMQRQHDRRQRIEKLGDL